MSVRLTIDGIQLKSLRANRGLTMSELAEHACVSIKTIQRAEASHPITTESAKRIADALSVDVSEIASAKEEEEPKPIAIKADTDTVTVELTLNRAYEEFTDEDKKRLLEAISKLLSTTSDFRVSEKHDG